MGLSTGIPFLGSGGLSVTGALTPAQTLVASFASSPGLVDALLLFDPAHYSAPGSTPGHLQDALGGPVSYTAPNTQATPTAVQDASGYYYAIADGMDDTLIASANQTVAWYCAVFRSIPAAWNEYAAPINTTDDRGDNTRRLGNVALGATTWDGNGGPRSVRKNGAPLSTPYDCAPITTWMMMTVLCQLPGAPASILQVMGNFNKRFLNAALAALAIRYTDPTSDQQLAIEARVRPMQQALFSSSL